MQWREFVTKWAKKDLKIESLELGQQLTTAEIETILASFPDTEQFLQQQEVAKILHISPSTVKARFTSVYEKCGLSNNKEPKQELRKRSIAEFNQLPQPSQSQTPKSIEPSPPLTQIDWLAKCRELLIDHKKDLATNALQGTLCKNFDNIYVPLGLVKREEKQRPTLDRQLDPAADRGSELYQEQTTPISHADFLETVREPQSSERHIVILGEPGAGKTTLLTRVWASLLDCPDANTPQIVAWVPLARLQTGDLEDYLQHVWLKQICNTSAIPTYWESFLELAAAGKVWLLLDGADEMGGDGLSAIATALKLCWTGQLCAVVTCRLNLWDTGKNVLRSNFQIFRTLEFRYSDPDRPDRDEVAEFIYNWFGTADPAAGRDLRAALEETGKERIKDLARNPLRLTLLCNIWQRAQRLPDTQAGLYRAFVNYFYEWKATPEIGGLRTDLDRVMGELAKYGLNKPALRFRFTAAELRDRVGSKYLEALKASGWLNCVGVEREQPTEEIYAFFHPTFQEYFAACSIEDWDYFLPRSHWYKPVRKGEAVPTYRVYRTFQEYFAACRIDDSRSHRDKPVACEGEEVPIYRVFEAQWRQVILLWMGRENEDIAAQKDEFIEKLMNFDDGVENQFYFCRAYYIAAICVGEFRDSCWAEEIVEQIVEWAFGHFDTEKKKWQGYAYPISSLARETIPFTHRRKAIDTLVALLQDSRYRKLRDSIAEALGEIAINDQQAINTLATLVQDSQLGNKLRCDLAEALGKIAINDRQAIDALVKLIGDLPLDCVLRYNLAYDLGKIAINDRQAIDALVKLIGNPLPEYWLRSRVANPLGKIAVNDREAIDALVSLVGGFQLGNWMRCDLAEALGKIDVGNRQAIDALVELIGDPQLENWLESKVAEALGKVAVNDRQAIDALVALMGVPQLFYVHHELHNRVVEALGQIALNDRQAIDALVALMGVPQLFYVHHKLRNRVVEALSQIAINDRQAIDALVALMGDLPLNCLLHCDLANVLGEIAVNDRKSIDALVELMGDRQLDDGLRSSVAYTLSKITTNRHKIDALVEFIAYVIDPNLDPDVRIKWLDRGISEAIVDLREIAVNDRKAIDALVALIGDPQLRDWLRGVAASALGEIAVNDRKAIDALVALRRDHQPSDWLRSRDWLRFNVAAALGQIDVAIDALVALIGDPQLEDLRRGEAAAVLGEIAVNDQKTMDALVPLLRDPQIDLYLHTEVEKALIKIVTPKIMPSAIWQLKNYVTNEVYHSNKQFNYCYPVLFHCAQTLPYPDFYTAWHPPHSLEL